jgi:hypothetical protein
MVPTLGLAACFRFDTHYESPLEGTGNVHRFCLLGTVVEVRYINQITHPHLQLAPVDRLS